MVSKRFVSGFLLVLMVSSAPAGEPGAEGDLYVAGRDEVVQYDGATGALVGTFASGEIDEAHGLTFGPNGNLFVADRHQFDEDSNRVLEYDGTTGAFVRAFVPTGGGPDTGWLTDPYDLLFLLDGRLVVASSGEGSLLAYDAATALETPGATAEWLGIFAIGGRPPDGLQFPWAIAQGPNGNIFVASSSTSGGTEGVIIEYHRSTGRLVRHFSAPGDMVYPMSLAFRSDGHLFVATFYDGVVEFDGITGAYLGPFTQTGGLDTYRGITFGVNGNLFVVGQLNSADVVVEYDGTTGALIGTFASEGLPITANHLVFKLAPPDPMPAPTISGVSVSEHDSCEPLTGVTVTGTNLDVAQTTVMLSRDDVDAGYVGQVTGGSSTALTVDFDLDGGIIEMGQWDVAALNPDGQSDTLSSAMQITGCGAARAGNLFTGSGRHRQHTVAGIMEYDGETADVIGWLAEDQSESCTGELWQATPTIAGPNGNLFVATGFNGNNVVEFDGITGKRIGVFVPEGSGGLGWPRWPAFGPNGNLFVLDAMFVFDDPPLGHHESAVFEYDGFTGAFIQEFVPRGSCGLGDDGGSDLAFGPNANLFVTATFSGVVEFDGQTGACIGLFGETGEGVGEGQSTVERMVFSPHSGNMLVLRMEFGANYINEYDIETGVFVRTFVPDGSGGVGAMWSMGFGPNGNLFVTSQYPHGIFEFDGTSGDFIQSYTGGEAGLILYFGLVFGPVPGDADDDWDLDLADFARMQQCFGDPGVPPSNTNCLKLDRDRDGDIDMCDAAAFSGAVTGPN